MSATDVLILGAGGQIARHVVDALATDDSIHQTLFLRDAQDLRPPPNATVVEGDVLDRDRLGEAIAGQDIVYANLAGPVDEMATSIVEAMDRHGIRRLIFVTSLGIYDEIPGAFGRWNRQMIGSSLVTYREAADVIEASDLDYTIVRPAWLTDADEVDYETTQKGESFKGTEVSRKSVGAYIAGLVRQPDTDVRASVGVNKPGTEGDKPSFY